LFSDGRVLSDPFIQLPTRRDLPDYYEIIKKPIDLKRIQARIKDNKYASLDMLAADMDLMAKNTQEYNVEGSLVRLAFLNKFLKIICVGIFVCLKKKKKDL